MREREQGHAVRGVADRRTRVLQRRPECVLVKATGTRIDTAQRSPFTSTETASAAFGNRNENSRTTGTGFGRPPTRLSVPCAIEVAAGANSRAKGSRLSFDAALALIFSTTSRASSRPQAPNTFSLPSTSTRVSVNAGRPC